jgi:hypothetical protein
LKVLVLRVHSRISAALRAWTATLRRRPKVPIELIAYRPLHAGAMLYVADVDAHRVIFVTAARAACLLATYPIGELPHERQEAPSGAV